MRQDCTPDAFRIYRNARGIRVLLQQAFPIDQGAKVETLRSQDLSTVRSGTGTHGKTFAGHLWCVYVLMIFDF
jgi:hypothetical protein